MTNGIMRFNIMVDLVRALEKKGTKANFGTKHLNAWVKLILDGRSAGVNDPPNWDQLLEEVEFPPPAVGRLLPHLSCLHGRGPTHSPSSWPFRDSRNLPIATRRERRTSVMTTFTKCCWPCLLVVSSSSSSSSSSNRVMWRQHLRHQSLVP